MSRHTCFTGLLPCSVLFALGCSGGNGSAVDRPPTPDSASIAQARRAADALGKDLMPLLLGALERGGPAEAVAFCADSAQVRTARHREAGIDVRRVGTRVRNPANAPDSVERSLLDQLAAGLERGALPQEIVTVIPGPDNSFQLQYLRPIVVAEPCLACHGDPTTFAPLVTQLLATRYPEDQATGYRVGDLRGGITVRIPLTTDR